MADELKLVEMGFIKAAFGVKGWVKLSAQTEYADSLFDYKTWYLRKDKGDWQAYTLDTGKVVPDGILAKLTGVDARDQAHALKGFTIAVPREEFAQITDDDEYYWTDLIGMQVSNLEAAKLGEVVDLMQTGAHDILVVKGEHGQKLIPFVSQFIHEVDSEQKNITVDWGLDY